MKNNIGNAFKNIAVQPTPTLAGDIWHAISVRQSRSDKIRSWGYAFTGSASLIWLVFAVKDLFAQFTQSGFYDYLSLAFTGGGSVAVYWKEFALTLADSLPTTSLIFCLVAVFILFISIRRSVRQFKVHTSLRTA